MKFACRFKFKINVLVTNYEMPDDLLYDEDDFVLVYTDGACLNNGKWNAAAGIGVVFNDYHPAWVLTKMWKYDIGEGFVKTTLDTVQQR